jgi:hypothetical protein
MSVDVSKPSRNKRRGTHGKPNTVVKSSSTIIKTKWHVVIKCVNVNNKLKLRNRDRTIRLIAVANNVTWNEFCLPTCLVVVVVVVEAALAEVVFRFDLHHVMTIAMTRMMTRMTMTTTITVEHRMVMLAIITIITAMNMHGIVDVATKGNLVSRPRNPGLREKYLLALHSKIRQDGSPESGIAHRDCESTSAARPVDVSYAQALRWTRGK